MRTLTLFALGLLGLGLLPPSAQAAAQQLLVPGPLGGNSTGEANRYARS